MKLGRHIIYENKTYVAIYDNTGNCLRCAFRNKLELCKTIGRTCSVEFIEDNPDVEPHVWLELK